MERTQYWNNVQSPSNDELLAEANKEKAKKSLKIASQLKNSGFKDCVMKECKSLFIDEKFEELLDSSSNLIGFMNCSYDVKTQIFITCWPEDYISHSSKINFIPYYPDSS